jgi:hypothetical protein
VGVLSRRITVVVTVMLCAGLSVAAASATAGHEVAGGYCLGIASVTVTYGPGGVFDKRTVTEKYTAYDRCHMSDPSIKWATESGTATGTFSCYSFPTGEVTGKDTFRWSNGRKSVLEYHDTVLGFFADTIGTITRGQFKGLHVHYQGPAVPTSLDPCTSPKDGTMHITYAGVGRFG